jgi:hypothetical protein
MEYEIVRVVQIVPGVTKVTTDLFTVLPEGIIRI